jgi:hypothetical protein
MPSSRACGARPSTGVDNPRRRPCRERREMARRAFFSEGRGLRARTVRPDEWQGIALPPVPFREAGGQKDETSALALCRHYGRAEPVPAPLRGGPNATWVAPRGKTRRQRGGRFSRRDAVSASANTGRTETGTCHRDSRVGEGPVAKTRQRCGLRDAFLTGVRSPPLRGGRAKVRGPCGANPGIMWRVVPSEGRGLRARIARPYPCQDISLPEVGGRVAVA